MGCGKKDVADTEYSQQYRIREEHIATTGRQFIDALHVSGSVNVQLSMNYVQNMLNKTINEAPMTREQFRILASVKKILTSFNPDDMLSEFKEKI